MRKIYNFLFVSVLAVGLITMMDSCGKTEGCTDPEAENYNASADVSDGSCMYARDKFIGTYIGNLQCQAPLPNDEEFTMVITEGLTNNSEVLISFEGVDAPLPELSARVEGDMLIIDPERTSVPLDPNNPDMLTEIEFSGDATLAGESLSGQLQTKVVILGVSTFCNFTATKQ